MRVLLIEDDAMIAKAVVQALRDAAYAVECVTDGRDAVATLALQSFDIVLLDLGLPSLDGLEVLRQLRAQRNDVPVLVITARDAVENRIEGLDLGADDYLSKPFAVGELLARMRALLRRERGSANPVLSNGRLSLDPVTKQVSAGDQAHALSGREFALLRALLTRPGAILSRAELEERIYGSGEEIDSNVVEYIIHGLRKKLGADAIRNVRGMGWMVERAS